MKRRAQRREAEEGLGKWGMASKERLHKGQWAHHLHTYTVSSKEAHSISLTTQACEANSRAPDTLKQLIIVITLIGNTFLSMYYEPNSMLSTFHVSTTRHKNFRIQIYDYSHFMDK